MTLRAPAIAIGFVIGMGVAIGTGFAISLATAAPQAKALPPGDCSASTIATVAEAIARLPDNKQKKAASEEIGLASEAMAQGRTDDCKDHLLKATPPRK